MALVWLAVRLYVGYAWIEAGFHKVQDPAWIDTGLALKGFWLNAAKIPAPPAKPYHVRLVPQLPAVPARQQHVHLVRQGHRVR